MPHDEATEAVIAPPGPAGAEPAATRVLVIEDEPRIASMVARSLEAAGFEVLVAPDGTLGEFLLGTETVGALVLDLGLPDRDGLELLHELRTQDADLPVLIVTALDDPAALDACREVGACAVLTKPFDLAELRARLAALGVRTPADEAGA